MSHIARKRFGQHFLRDQRIISDIVQAIAPKANDLLVEIGPGLGALTQPLLQIVNKLQVVEIDRDIIPQLQKYSDKYPDFTIHQCDALKFDFSSLSSKDNKLRIVGNLPYNISTPLLFHLLTFIHAIDDMHFMLQKEVVDRLAAQPGHKSYGRLSVMIQAQCEVQALFDVSKNAFDPPPNVESAVVRLKPTNKVPIHVNQDTFANITRQAFSQRRKTLRNNLKGILDEVAINSIGIDPQCRAETLTVQQFAQLANLVDQ